MPTDRQLDDRISRWLEAEAPGQMPDRVLRATFERTRKTRQQAGWQAVLGRILMNRMTLAVGAVVAVVAVLLAGAQLLGPPANVGGPAVEATPTPQASVVAPTSTPGNASLPEGPFALEDQGMAMTLTIPASGWTFLSEFTALTKGEEVANLPEAAVLFWSWPAGTRFYVPGDPCRATSTRPDTPATTVDDFAAALATQASRDASQPVDATVGGYSGKSITLHVPKDAVPDECELNEFVSYGTEQDPLNRYHQGPGQIDELWILDVDGAFVIIDAMYRPDTAKQLVEEMRTMAESTTFGE
jgi:hypothetical protein